MKLAVGNELSDSERKYENWLMIKETQVNKLISSPRP
jgi:hypothetical protein